MKKLTKKQKKLIIRLQIGNMLAKCSDSIFDVEGITEEERQELLDGVQDFGWDKLQGLVNPFYGAEEIIKYVREN